MSAVEVPVLVSSHLAIDSHHLQRRDVVALCTTVFQLSPAVGALLIKIQRPIRLILIQILRPVHSHFADVARGISSVALLLARWRRAIALRALTSHLSGLHALFAARGARLPFRGLPAASGNRFACRTGGGLVRTAILIHPTVALDSPLLRTTPTAVGAHAPASHDPLHCAPHSVFLIDLLPRGRNLSTVGTLRRLLTNHRARWSWAGLRSPATPLTSRLRTCRLAPKIVRTVQPTLGLRTTSHASWVRAIQCLRAIAQVLLLWTIHGTIRLVALNLADLVRVWRQLRASCLALGYSTMRCTLLLTDWIGALPCAMRHATDSLVERYQSGVRR
mmetsp:Transcript_42172/g.101416  ORF Transcript_42172/g.101416 Transcript_42172/m.101416 type:complete len:333 (-) Transcript_42172:67-1065(-)